jgi:hypothetical protein
MKAIDDNRVELLKQTVPDWVKAVQKSKEKDANLIMTLDAFANDPRLLFDALWFAHGEGVAVMLAPSTQERGER